MSLQLHYSKDDKITALDKEPSGWVVKVMDLCFVLAENNDHWWNRRKGVRPKLHQCLQKSHLHMAMSRPSNKDVCDIQKHLSRIKITIFSSHHQQQSIFMTLMHV